MRKLIPVVAAMSVLAVPAWASPKCTSEPQSRWLSEAVMKAKIAKMGYKNIRVFQKTMSGCYEIYGFTADNKKAEVYFNPVTGAVVEKNVDGE
ncbi:MAG: PepSY domain-containing protein [Alphaproteobacteria bacterium]|nr:PepSY domain-containing protein [Alphaproteobacteria bacterium]